MPIKASRFRQAPEICRVNGFIGAAWMAKSNQKYIYYLYSNYKKLNYFLVRKVSIHAKMIVGFSFKAARLQ